MDRYLPRSLALVLFRLTNMALYPALQMALLLRPSLEVGLLRLTSCWITLFACLIIWESCMFLLFWSLEGEWNL
jgi:hypothetical protein